MHCERINVILPQHADFPGVAGLIPFTGQVSITFWTYQSYMMNHKSLLIDMFPSNDFFFKHTKHEIHTQRFLHNLANAFTFYITYAFNDYIFITRL